MSSGANRLQPTTASRRSFVTRVFVGSAVLVLLAWFIDLRAVWSQLTGVAVGALAATVPVYCASAAFQTWRWRVALRSRQIDLGAWPAARLILAGNFLSLFLPGSFGGDVYRVYGSYRQAASLLQSAGLVMLERYCGFLASFAMALAAMTFGDYYRRHTALAILVGGLFLAVLLPLALGSSRWLASRADRTLRRLALVSAAELLARVSTALRSFVATPGLMLRVMALSAAMKLCVAAIIYLLGVGLGLPMSGIDLLVFLPIHTVVSALPVSVNGLGLREVNLVAFFIQMGQNAEQAASLAFLLLVWTYLAALPGGICLSQQHSPESADDA